MTPPGSPEWLNEESIEMAREALAKDVERREFLRRAGRWAGGALLAGVLGGLVGCGAEQAVKRTAPVATSPESTAPAAGGSVDFAVAAGGGDPGALARKAVEALGGMKRFVPGGSVVAIKPNASFMDGPEAGTSTHPSVVGAVVAMCREAGASRVIVTDHCLRGAADLCFSRNGIGAAAKDAGGEVIAYGGSDSGRGKPTPIPDGIAMKSADFYPLVMDADVLITVPKAKHHSSSELSLGMKNLMGTIGHMSNVHNYDLHQGIADLASLLRPNLSIVDASVVLLENGPGGPGPTKSPGTVIASPDFVAADSFACTLFGMSGSQVGYVADAARMGLGTLDYTTLKTANV